MKPSHGIETIKAALDIVGGDRLWMKYGHGRFVLLLRDGDDWQVHSTALGISEEQMQAEGLSEGDRSRSRHVNIQPEKGGLTWLLETSQSEDDGVFWVPAGIDADLPLKKCIDSADVLSCEIDNADQGEQIARYEWFEKVSGLSYGLQLSSGSKSVHSHIFLDEAIAIDAAVRLRRLFVLCLLGDPAVTRQHQPMRFPGFFRREKGRYQELMTVSQSRYSLTEVERGLRAAFADLDWAYPETLSGEFWADLQRLLKKDIPDLEKRTKLGKLLQRGDSFYAERAAARAEKQKQQAAVYAQKQLIGEFDLRGAIENVERQLSATEAFNAAGHRWAFSGHNHARGYCQFSSHQSKNKTATNSAWLSQVNGKWVFHCPTCSDDKPLSSFQYWVAERRGPASATPRGKDWAVLAKEWLELHGVSVPEPQRISALLPSTESSKPATPQQTQKEWLEQQRKERDARAYAQIAKLLGIKADIDLEQDREDYQADARTLFFKPLKKYLKYETKGELERGFVDEVMPFDEGRSLIAYDASKGTGKSNNALIPVALRTAGSGRVLIFVPTRGLAKEFKNRINVRAGDNIAATHLDDKFYTASIVVTCPESAYKFKGAKFDLILIDEANEVFHRIESGELGNAGPQSLASFRKLLASVPVLGIATDELSGRTLAAAQTIGGFTPDEVKLQRRVRPETQMNINEYSNFYLWLLEIIRALEDGLRVSIPTGSQGKGRAIDRILREFFPKKTGLVIDGRATLANQRTRFLSDPDAFLEVEKPDWFIFTPVINSGVSIEKPHFDLQFEYATPHESAQSISQRGERVRSAIGRDGAMVERHVYFSSMGAPTLEAYPETFDWQYWRGELSDEANAPIGAAAALAKALGAERALKPVQDEQEKFAGMRPNLPHFLALKAFEIIFKKELLHAEWQRYGWKVQPPIKPNDLELEEIDALKEKCDRIQIGLIEQQGRTLKKTQTRESEGEIEEINNPFQAARAAKQQIEKVLGKEYLSQQSEGFYTAWISDKSAENPGVRAVVRSQLLQIATTDPDCWQQIERMKALKFLAGKPTADEDLLWHLPELPAAARDIELIGVIGRCPLVADILSGKVEQWTNQDSQVIAAGLYLVAHAKQIAANTKKQGLVRGAKFSDEMAPAALLNKALDLAGYKPIKDKRQGTGDRLNVYRLATAADAEEVLKELKACEGESALKLFRAELNVVRAQTRASIDAAAKNQILSKALGWVSEKMGDEVEKAIAAIKGRHAVLIDSGLSKVGDVLKMDVAPPAIKQKELVFAVGKASEVLPDSLSDDFYDASAWE